MDREITNGQLLDKTGNLCECGFAYNLCKEYNRQDIKGLKTRIKEWDYYEFNCGDFGVALTIADNSYMAMVSVSFLDFKYQKSITKSIIKFFSFGKVNLPNSSIKGDIKYKNKDFDFQFLNDGTERHLICKLNKFTKYSSFECDILVDEKCPKSMVIATPFKKDKHFYYNQKINNLVANGYLKIGEGRYEIKNGIGVLDWGRGVWTYSNTWYWGSLSYKDKEGNYIGFNLGYGFGDTSAASENMVFFNKDAYKLNDVQFLIPKNEKGKYEYLKPWKIISNNNDINLTFKPVLDRHDDTNLLVLCSLQHQVFGKFNGEIRVNKKIIKIVDALGFAERVTNRW